jgi:formylmethanofuran dehydrogenase subunit E
MRELLDQSFLAVPVSLTEDLALDSAREVGYCHSCGRPVLEISICHNCGFITCQDCLVMRNGIPYCLVCLERQM